MKHPVLFAAVAAISSPALAQDPLAPLPGTPAEAPPQSLPVATPAPEAVAAPLVAPARVPRDWREVFTAIRAGRWTDAQAGIAALPGGVLTPVARAELYTAKGSPVVALEQLTSLLMEAPDLPQAEQLAKLAAIRGATATPPIAAKRPLVWLGNSPSRYRAKPIDGEPAADVLRATLDPLIKADAAPDAELALMKAAPNLSYDARAEAGQRVAWSYYSVGRDLDARRVADTYRAGAGAEWGSQAAWVSALAAWRLGDCTSAARRFREVGGTAVQRELGAAGYYWAARAEQACRRPQAVESLLKAAAASPESFYGLLARETLGAEKSLPAKRAHANIARVDDLPNVQRAAELVRIGEPALAEEMLRHQARIGAPADHQALLGMARDLQLAGAQFWLAHNGQQGALVEARDRYPMPAWSPARGWRIDPALGLAHMRQESNFRAAAVSPAGAVGLMQVLPITAAQLAGQNGQVYPTAALLDPTVNIEFGQSYIEKMRSSAATQGWLPKIIAAYNAGPLPVQRWVRAADNQDPLLWIESIPYWETRYYVPSVLRNLWVYQGLEGAPTPTLGDLAQHRWPALPMTRTASRE